MHPERLHEIREALADQPVTNGALGWAHDLLAEVDRHHGERRDLYDAGWRDGHRAAHRTITTLEEWHELPYGSVVIGRLGEVILKDELGKDYGFMPYRLGGISEDVDGEFPATVVHTPSAPAGDR